VDIFIEALNHPEAAVRENAAAALSKIQDRRVVPLLLELLRDPARDVQKRALQSLAELRDPRSLPTLQEIVSNRADREFSMLAKQIIESMK